MAAAEALAREDAAIVEIAANKEQIAPKIKERTRKLLCALFVFIADCCGLRGMSSADSQSSA